MATITEDYVSFEIAKLLKEKGFLKEVDLRMTQNLSFYDNIGLSHNLNKYYDRLIQDKINFVVAPTLQMAMKWLREVHNLSVRPRYDEVEDEKEQLHYVWFFDILSMNPYKTLVEPVQGYSTYEEATEAAIKYCLENLI